MALSWSTAFAGWLAAAAFCGAPATAQQVVEEPVAVFTEHPRLLLRPSRLRFLRRERERNSPRWTQFHTLLAGGAPMPEPGFALALEYQISGDAAAGRRAITWAQGPSTDLRQLALVFDWCQELLDPAQKREMIARLVKAMETAGKNESVASMRARAFAAIALYDEVPDSPPRELRRIVRGWWEGTIAPALAAGRNPIPRDDAYPLLELFFALRDNANIDLRDACPQAFKKLPIERLMSYYPASYMAPENEYRIGAEPVLAEPDVRRATLSRAADMALVAFDPDATECQYLQGWLMHDSFVLRAPFGASYEFLWANPYQPGLSYFHVPPVYHDPLFGSLYVRSTWEEDASWFGYFGGVAQTFSNGRPAMVDSRRATPIRLGSATVYLGEAARRFRVSLVEGERVFLAGLKPRHTYRVEVDDEEMYEAAADPGGILEIDLPSGREVGVRIAE